MKLESKVVDSWAMVAWIQQEPAAPLVRQFLYEADAGKVQLFMSAINVGETFYILAKRRSVSIAEEFLERLPSLPIHVVVPDADGIIAAARIKAEYAVAYGDSFAIALAQAEDASVITGDGEIQQSGLVSVDWVGSQPSVAG
ncbi:MAG: PilT-like protein [Bryobacterales bacterium]|nr:PilT-like protein [Bryobacterales bacterium]